MYIYICIYIYVYIYIYIYIIWKVTTSSPLELQVLLKDVYTHKLIYPSCYVAEKWKEVAKETLFSAT